MVEFDAAGINIYAISYDSQAQLKKFAERYGITFDLLSDDDSTVIKRFGILNTLIRPDDAMAERFYGIPWPGTYVVDSQGVVTEKFFQRHYATRDSAGSLLHSALGKVLIPKESPQAVHQDERLKITAFLGDEDLKLEYTSRIYVRIELAEGLHIYGEPLPEGFVATTVKVEETKGLRAGKPVYPKTTPKEFEGLDATLNIYEGIVDIAIPVTATKEVRNWGQKRTQDSLGVDLVVRYQACTESVCHVPRTEELTLEIPLAEVMLPRR